MLCVLDLPSEFILIHLTSLLLIVRTASLDTTTDEFRNHIPSDVSFFRTLSSAIVSCNSEKVELHVTVITFFCWS